MSRCAGHDILWQTAYCNLQSDKHSTCNHAGHIEELAPWSQFLLQPSTKLQGILLMHEKHEKKIYYLIQMSKKEFHRLESQMDKKVIISCAFIGSLYLKRSVLLSSVLSRVQDRSLILFFAHYPNSCWFWLE